MSAIVEPSQKYLLGLDLGSASLGWALIALDSSEAPTGLMKTGVRIFEPGVDGTELEIQEGKDQSKAVNRRIARLHRRQIRRKAYRQAKLFRLLQEHGLFSRLTTEALSPSAERDAILTLLDREINQRAAAVLGNSEFAQLPLYRLRRRALDDKLEPCELGRVLYHLGQRRGFKSNRKETAKTTEKEKEDGAVKAGIAELQRSMETAGARTLGEYFADLNPHEIGQRIRKRWTARSMYEDEFAQIWRKQAEYYPELLTENLRREISHLLFFQRPIAAQSHLIGKCELEPDQRRAAWATLEAQRFRILQKVNDLKVIYPGDPMAQPLSAAERQFVFDLLDREGDQKFKTLRGKLKLDKHSEFNLERGGETGLRGNRTNAAMIASFGEKWDSLSPEAQKQIVEEWRTSESDEALFRRGIEYWVLEEASAKKWVEAKPEGGYCSLSRRAIQKLTPLMLDGKAFKEAENGIYGSRFSGGPVLGFLPPLHVHCKTPESAKLERLLKQLRLSAIRNPAVARGLTELRKVVNAIVREHGRPHEIRVELARELKKPRKERQSISKKNRTRQKERDEMKAVLLRECGIQYPSRQDIEKALLHEECGGICPYTGRSIRLADLFGEHPQFDVEHIIPISRYPDDSFQNKTLCWHEENRNHKRNKTPFEAYSADAERWETIQTRVQAWKPGNPGKLKRFQVRSKDELTDFTARQMNDTRYASVLACRLLESLYGGRDVETPTGTRQAIFASSGAVTATLRRHWQLEGILREAMPSSNGQSKGKPRTDHRHHAVDAIVIALTKQAVVQSMSRAASLEPATCDTSRAFRRIPSPWPNFVDSVRPYIAQMVVSHRPEHKVSGALHKETIYGTPYKIDSKDFVNVRRPLASLSVKQIESIVDKNVRAAVVGKLTENGGDPKLFIPEKPETLPFLTSRTGTRILIKKARVREAAGLESLRALPGNRFVEPKSIHHVEIFAVRERGKERWHGEVVDIMQAYDRLRKKQPVVRKFLDVDSDAEADFLFSIMKGDTVELDYDGMRRIFRVKKFYSAGPIWFTGVNNAQALLPDDQDTCRSDS